MDKHNMPGDVAMQSAWQIAKDCNGVDDTYLESEGFVDIWLAKAASIIQLATDKAWQDGYRAALEAAALLVDRDWFSHEEGDVPLECKYGKQIRALPIPPAPEGRE